MANEQITFLIGLVLIIALVLALCVFGFFRTKRKYAKGQGLLQKPRTAKILKIILIAMIIMGLLLGLFGFMVFLSLGAGANIP